MYYVIIRSCACNKICFIIFLLDGGFSYLFPCALRVCARALFGQFLFKICVSNQEHPFSWTLLGFHAHAIISSSSSPVVKSDIFVSVLWTIRAHSTNPICAGKMGNISAASINVFEFTLRSAIGLPQSQFYSNAHDECDFICLSERARAKQHVHVPNNKIMCSMRSAHQQIMFIIHVNNMKLQVVASRHKSRVISCNSFILVCSVCKFSSWIVLELAFVGSWLYAHQRLLSVAILKGTTWHSPLSKDGYPNSCKPIQALPNALEKDKMQ